jgi:hypothetical protein
VLTDDQLTVESFRAERRIRFSPFFRRRRPYNPAIIMISAAVARCE